MSIVLKNNASDFLAAAIDSSQTSITLQSAASFPSLGANEYFYGTIEDTAGQVEIVKVTARVGNTLTVVRAQEDTTAASFAQGSRFELRVTAGSIEGGPYNPAGTDAVTSTIQEKLQEVVSVKDFGAVGDGVTDDSEAILAAINAAVSIGNGRGYVVFPTATYGIGSQVTVAIGTNSCVLDLDNSTLARTNGWAGTYIRVNSGDVTIKNGVMDGLNGAASFGHLVWFRNADNNFVVENMEFKNQVLGWPVPVKIQDTDHVYVQFSKSFTARNCRFFLASRQGISFTSLTAGTEEVVIQDCFFERCFLFGIDFEPNTEVEFLYKKIQISNNTFLDCGTLSTTLDVWDNGGPLAITRQGSTLKATQSAVITGNVFRNTLPASPSDTPGYTPSVRLWGVNNLVFSDNIIDNVGRTVIGTTVTIPGEAAVISGNTWTNSPGLTANSRCAIQFFDHVSFTNNIARRVEFAGNIKNLAITGNTVRNSDISYGIRANASETVVIAGNSFSDLPSKSAIEAPGAARYVISGNSIADDVSTFLPAGQPSDGLVIGNFDGGTPRTPGRFITQTFTINIAPGSPVVIYDLADTNRIGRITIRDPFGTRIGSTGVFANFYDGSTNSSVLSQVIDSPASGSTLTLNGDDIEFEHSAGTTRTLTVTVAWYT